MKKGQNKDQVAFAISATSKSLYSRLFDWVVGLVNDSLDTPNPRKHFIGKGSPDTECRLERETGFSDFFATYFSSCTCLLSVTSRLFFSRDASLHLIVQIDSACT